MFWTGAHLAFAAATAIMPAGNPGAPKEVSPVRSQVSTDLPLSRTRRTMHPSRDSRLRYWHSDSGLENRKKEQIFSEVGIKTGPEVLERAGDLPWSLASTSLEVRKGNRKPVGGCDGDWTLKRDQRVLAGMDPPATSNRAPPVSRSGLENNSPGESFVHFSRCISACGRFSISRSAGRRGFSIEKQTCTRPENSWRKELLFWNNFKMSDVLQNSLAHRMSIGSDPQSYAKGSAENSLLSFVDLPVSFVSIKTGRSWLDVSPIHVDSGSNPDPECCDRKTSIPGIESPETGLRFFSIDGTGRGFRKTFLY